MKCFLSVGSKSFHFIPILSSVIEYRVYQMLMKAHFELLENSNKVKQEV